MLLLGLLATITTFLLLRSNELRNSERQFVTWTQEHRDLLQKEVDSHLQILHGLSALFDSSDFVSAQEFSRYTSGYLERYPHVYSLDWAPRVSLEAAIRIRSARKRGTWRRVPDQAAR